MKERFKEHLEEFHKEAYTSYRDERSWEEGIQPEPTGEDKFFLLEESAGDEFDGLIFYSDREETYHEWNESFGEWCHLSDEDVPNALCELTGN